MAATASTLDELAHHFVDETVIAERDAARHMLRDVLATLAGSCASDEHRKLYEAAYALVAEAGLRLDEAVWARQIAAYEAWEAAREFDRLAKGTTP